MNFVIALGIALGINTSPVCTQEVKSTEAPATKETQELRLDSIATEKTYFEQLQKAMGCRNCRVPACCG